MHLCPQTNNPCSATDVTLTSGLGKYALTWSLVSWFRMRGIGGDEKQSQLQRILFLWPFARYGALACSEPSFRSVEAICEEKSNFLNIAIFAIQKGPSGFFSIFSWIWSKSWGLWKKAEKRIWKQKQNSYMVHNIN